jgi:uncharacterized small protein (DUF1192 family)
MRARPAPAYLAGGGGLTQGGVPEESAAMDLDELFPSKPDDPLTLLAKQDLDPFSVEELEARIVALQAEIERVQAKLDASVQFRASADELFRK